jgi:hypothetical protein
MIQKWYPDVSILAESNLRSVNSRFGTSGGMTVWRPDSWPWASKPTSSAYLRNSRIWKWHKNAGQEKTNTYKSHTSHIKSHQVTQDSVGIRWRCLTCCNYDSIVLVASLLPDWRLHCSWSWSLQDHDGWPMVDQWLTHLGTTKMVSLGLVVDTQSHSPTFGLSATHSAIKSMTRYEHSTHTHTYTHKTHLHVLCLQQWQDSQPRLGILTARVLQIAKCCFDYLLNIFILYSFIFYCSENAHENGRRLRNDQHVQSCLRVNSSKYAWVVLPPSFMSKNNARTNQRKLEKRLLTYERTKLINITLTQHHITSISHPFITLLQPHIIPTSPYFKTHITSTTHYLNLTSHQAQITSTSHHLNLTLPQHHITATSHFFNVTWSKFTLYFI